MNDIKKHEAEILQILCRETKPMGSGQLRALLLQRGFNLARPLWAGSCVTWIRII